MCKRTLNFSIFSDETGNIISDSTNEHYGCGVFVVEDKHLKQCRIFLNNLKKKENIDIIHFSKMKDWDQKKRICNNLNRFLKSKNCFFFGFIEENINLGSDLVKYCEKKNKLPKKLQAKIIHLNTLLIRVSVPLCKYINSLNLNYEIKQINIKFFSEITPDQIINSVKRGVYEDFKKSMGYYQSSPLDKGIKDLLRKIYIDKDWFKYQGKKEEDLLQIADVIANTTFKFSKNEKDFYNSLKEMFRKSYDGTGILRTRTSTKDITDRFTF